MTRLNNIELTAILLTYNHDHVVTETIKSILAQTYSQFEFIISDDCSTDNTYAVISKFTNKYKNIRIIKTKSNLGVAGNANFAVSQSNGKFVAILHHDDILKPTLFEKWLNLYKKYPSIAFIFNDYFVSQRNIKSVHKQELNRKYDEIINGQAFLRRDLLRYWSCSVWGSAIIRKDCWDELSGMKKEFSLLADIDLWMRLAAKWDVGYINEALIDLRHSRKNDYPEIYKSFSWKRLFILFGIHSANINKLNYPNYSHYLIKRFVFRNKVSFEIIKWHLYALLKNKNELIVNFPSNNNYELFYSKFCRYIIRKVFIKSK